MQFLCCHKMFFRSTVTIEVMEVVLSIIFSYSKLELYNIRLSFFHFIMSCEILFFFWLQFDHSHLLLSTDLHPSKFSLVIPIIKTILLNLP